MFLIALTSLHISSQVDPSLIKCVRRYVSTIPHRSEDAARLMQAEAEDVGAQLAAGEDQASAEDFGAIEALAAGEYQALAEDSGAELVRGKDQALYGSWMLREWDFRGALCNMNLDFEDSLDVDVLYRVFLREGGGEEMEMEEEEMEIEKEKEIEMEEDIEMEEEMKMEEELGEGKMEGLRRSERTPSVRIKFHLIE